MKADIKVKLTKKRSQQEGVWGMIFVLPFLLILLAFQVVPLISTMYLSFTNMKGPSLEHQIIGFRNYLHSTKTFEMQDLDAETAFSLYETLTARGIDAYTDAPDPAETSDEVDPFALDFDTEVSDSDAATAEAESTMEDSEQEQTQLYLVRVQKMDSLQYTQLIQVLTELGYEKKELEASVRTVWAGILGDKFFWKTLGTTIFLFLASFIPQFLLALIFAVWFADKELKLRGVLGFKTLLYLPNMVMTSATVVLFGVLLAYPKGFVNNFLVQNLGFESAIQFRGNGFWLRAVAIFIQFWLYLGPTIIILSAGIMGISPSLTESARIDGAKPRQIFWKITLPLIRPVILYTTISSMVIGLQFFDVPLLYGGPYGGGNDAIRTSAMYVYNHALSSADNFSYGATISMGLLVVNLLLALVFYRFLRQRSAE